MVWIGVDSDLLKPSLISRRETKTKAEAGHGDDDDGYLIVFFFFFLFTVGLSLQQNDLRDRTLPTLSI